MYQKGGEKGHGWLTLLRSSWREGGGGKPRPDGPPSWASRSRICGVEERTGRRKGVRPRAGAPVRSAKHLGEASQCAEGEALSLTFLKPMWAFPAKWSA